MFSFLGRKKKITTDVQASLPEKHPEEEEAESRLKYAFEQVDKALEPTKTAQRAAQTVRQQAFSLRPRHAHVSGKK